MHQKYSKHTNLGCGVRNQLSQCRPLKSAKNSSIIDEKIVQLEKLGFQRETKDPEHKVNYTNIQEFKKQREHSEGPKEYSEWPPLNYRGNRLKNLYCLLKGWQRVCFPTENVEKKEKVSYRQAIGKNKKKSIVNRIHGRGIMMTLPKECYVLPDFSTLEEKK